MFVEIIMKCIIETKFVGDIKLTLLILAACLLQYTIILPLVSPGAPESVDYGPMCFEPDAPVLLHREPTDCHGCQFSSPNLHDGWSINQLTGDIEGIAEAGETGSIEVHATNEAGVVNTTVSYEVAPRFARAVAFKVAKDITSVSCIVAILFRFAGVQKQSPN